MRPVLSRIVATFDSPASAETCDFWNQMVQAKIKHSNVCGEPPLQYIVSGWILAFFYWDSEGKANERFAEGRGQYQNSSFLEYDGVRYGEAPLDDLPVGYAKAEFTMRNSHGGSGDFKGWVLAGSIGKSIVDGAPKGYKAALDLKNRTEGRSQAATSSNANSASGCYSGLLRGLCCFGSGKQGSKSSNVAKKTSSSEEQEPTGEMTEKTPSDAGHRTIQPLSAWFLIGPNEDLGPFYDGDELCGPTVDAIMSCEGVEHRWTTRRSPI